MERERRGQERSTGLVEESRPDQKKTRLGQTGRKLQTCKMFFLLLPNIKYIFHLFEIFILSLFVSGNKPTTRS